MQSVAVILGSAYGSEVPWLPDLEKTGIDTPWGNQTLYKLAGTNRPAWALFRHGVPHTLLPNQINYRAQAWALKSVGCGALLTTSSVGVLDGNLPLFEPLLLTDMLMPENRLPDGSVCTMFERPAKEQGHLVLSGGLFSAELNRQINTFGGGTMTNEVSDVVFAYAGGPRSKTPAENRMWARMGAHVNSMTLAPEVVLANELEIPCAGLVVGHKYSVPDIDNPPSAGDVTESLNQSRRRTETIILNFLREGRPVAFENHVYRFDR